MLAFIDSIPALRRVFLPYAKDYVISKIGEKPSGFGYGIELFELVGDKTADIINRYRRISNWTDNPVHYGNSYGEDIQKYASDPTEENADKVFEDILDILYKDWKQPFDPIQPAIGEVCDFDRPTH